jgi:hypothetical protein
MVFELALLYFEKSSGNFVLRLGTTTRTGITRMPRDAGMRTGASESFKFRQKSAKC